MKTKGTIRVLLSGALLLALSGCASYPISKSLRQQAKPVTLSQVRAKPSSFRGTTVIWGGQVIATVNSTNGGAIYVLQLPLKGDGKPKRHGVSTGRFIAWSNEFIDPQVFKKRRLVTVAGTISGVETLPLQDIQYTYPMLRIEEIHRWHRQPHYYYAYPGWNGYGPGWGWGWYGVGGDFDEDEEGEQGGEGEEEEGEH